MPTHGIEAPAEQSLSCTRLMIAVTAIVAALVGAIPASAQDAEPAKVTPWVNADEGDRNVVLRMLTSDDWPFRVFGLLRLERFSGGPVTELLGERLRDDAWQVRCFALRQAKRIGVKITPSDLANETDPRVLRTALRQGIDLPPELIRPIAIRLLRGRTLDHIMLGIEMAAASTDDHTRSEGVKVARRLISNMNPAIAAYVSKRLSRVLGLTRPIESAAAWRQYLNEVRGKIEFSVAESANNPFEGTSLSGKLPIFAEMDTQTFERLIDYMSALSQHEMDLVIVMDITQSMQPMLDEARAGVDSLVQFMSDITRTLRLGFVAYRDHDNPPVWQGHPFTRDVASIRDFLFNLSTKGGADYPEAVYDGLAACGEMRWNRAAARQIILVGDAPPHDRDFEKLETLLHHYSDTEIVVHAIHVPQKRDERWLRAVSPQQAEQDRRFLSEYNSNTAKVFSDMVKVGTGDFAFINESEELVPAVMHFTIDKNWWHVFDEFYALYLELCR